jgi:serine/threonine protein kinase
MRPAEGSSLADGRYVFERHLGSGGMASVWLARDARLERSVAIKLMADTLADDERWLARFKREARAAAAVSHPQIVKVFDFGIEDHRPYLVMAHIPGGSLRDRIQDGGALPDPERLARELLGALAHVHAAGIVHRDVKPGNVLLDEHDGSHLTDFGIARPQDATAMTQTGMVMGTIRYLAPEVAEGGLATERSDLYSAGGVIREVAGEDPPQRLAELIEALTDDDPERRPSSAEDALARLEDDAAKREPDTKRQETTAATVALERIGPDAGPRKRTDAEATQTQPRKRAKPALDAKPAVGAKPAMTRLDEVIRRPGFLPAAGIAAIVLLALIVIVLASSGGGAEKPSAAGSPAPASAPLSEQLRGLDRTIDAAASR